MSTATFDTLTTAREQLATKAASGSYAPASTAPCGFRAGRSSPSSPHCASCLTPSRVRLRPGGYAEQSLNRSRMGPQGEFGRIVIQDGCSFAVKDALREQYPGRFKKQNPAAVELHVTRSLLNESVEQVALTADTAPERPHLPSPEALRDDLLLADRGYFDQECLGAVDRAGGYLPVA